MLKAKSTSYTISYTIKLWDDNPWDGTQAEYRNSELHANNQQEVNQIITGLQSKYGRKIIRLTITTYEELI